jgi:CheY-like chemotaxis protein
MASKTLRQKFDLVFTHFRNSQYISAYNMFLALAKKEAVVDSSRAALLYILAAECRTRQEKNNRDEFIEAAKQYLKIAAKGDSYKAKIAYLCAAKCFLRAGKHDDAKDVFKKFKKIIPKPVEVTRSVLIVEDSNAVVMKLKDYLQKLGYNDVNACTTGSEALEVGKKILKDKKNPIVLLDIGLPDIDGDVVAHKLLELKVDIPIILITADEKSSKRVHKTISEGAAAFIQKPFTISDLETALKKVETEEVILKKQK